MNSVPTSLWEWLALLDSSERTGLAALAIVAIVFVTTVALITAYKIHKNRLEDALKRELLERGMNADEIAAIVRARPRRSYVTSAKCGVT